MATSKESRTMSPSGQQGQGAMNKMPNRARLFLTAVMLPATVIVVHAILGMRFGHGYESGILLIIAMAASRLRLRLPMLTGNMSVNVPFILIAVIHLSLVEALIVGMASTVTQCFPKDGGRPKSTQLLFNVSNMVVAVGMCNWVLRQALVAEVFWRPGTLLLPAAVTFFFTQTVSVAIIISLTEGRDVLRTWSSIFQLSFPYYVLSAGIATIVTTASNHMGWQIPILVLPIMYGVYRSYSLYFGRVETAPRFALAKGASC
jgi:hypothetical protein